MRYPTLSLTEMTERQRQVVGMHSHQFGSSCNLYTPLIYSPEIAHLTVPLMEYLRFNLRVPEPLRAMAVLLSASRHISTDADPIVRAMGVLDSGLGEETIRALLSGQHPAELSTDQEMVFDFCGELLKTGRVSNRTFNRTETRFGREICLELVMVCGCTAFLAMLVSTTQTSLQVE